MNVRRSNWRASGPLSGALVLTESVWASVLATALVHGRGGGHEDVPFLALFFPALVSLALASAIATRVASLGARAAAMVVPGVGAMVLGALAYDTVVLGGRAADVVTPWSASGAAGHAAVVALVLCGLAALRGAVVGLAEPRVRQAMVSLGIGTAVVLVTLLVAATHRSGEDAALARSTASMLVFAVPAGVAAMGLVRERQLERAGTGRAMQATGIASLLGVAAPIALAVAVALVIVALGSLVAPPVGHGLEAVGRGVGALISDFFGLFRHVHLKLPLRPASRPAAAPPRPLSPLHFHERPAGPIPWWLLGLGALAAAIVLSVAGVVVVRVLRRRPRRLARTAAIGEEVRDSVFSLAHVLAQLRSVLARHPEAGAHGSLGTAEDAVASVRRHYRRFLASLSAGGLARREAETAEELAARLIEPAGSAAPSLGTLTELYEQVRYGAAPEAGPVVARAGELVDEVAAAVLAHHARGGAEEAPAPK
ncbi:MAG: DUF4129 domain-containing protein [Actinomycetota bacterium]|nr:DUF4129 domain-containing protein [Actinomycetota bacterium]